MSEVRHLRPGVELQWHGERAVIRQVGAMVSISDVDGSRAMEVPVAEVAAVLRGRTAPADLAHLHDIESRLSETSLARFREESDLLHIMLTGRRSDQPDSDPPAADLNPALVPEGIRRKRLAVILAGKVRSKGKRKGFEASVRTEMRRLQRIMKRWRDKQNLLDGRYARPRTWRTDDAVMDLLLTFLDAHALRGSKSDKALVRAFMIQCAKEKPDVELPSITTLRRRVSEMRNGWSHLGASAKNRISELNVPESSGMTRLATRPGELVLFDTTKANVFVQDPRTERKFRLDVTLAIDLATRCIVGLAITHTTTKFAIGLCLADLLRPKTSEIAAAWTHDDDLVFNQPFIGRPDAFIPFYSTAFHPEGVVVDNGKQYVSTYVVAQMGRLGIHYEPQRSYTPTDKAQVERVFRTIKDMFEALMPGFTGGSIHEKGQDPQNEQLMSPEVYERRLRQCIDLYNHRTHEGLVLPEDPFARLSPYMMYGIRLAEIGAIADVEYEHEWVRFLPSVTAKISSSRVRAKRLNYMSPILRKMQGDPVVMKTGKLRIYYDPFDLRITWCFDAAGELHPLRWQYLTEHTPRFGEFHTTHIVDQFADKKIAANDIERKLVGIFSGTLDTVSVDESRHGQMIDSLMEVKAARLTDGAFDIAAQEEVLLRNETTSSLRSQAASSRSARTSESSRPDRPVDAAVQESGGARPRRALEPYARKRYSR